MTAHRPSVSAARTTHDIAIATLRLLALLDGDRGATHGALGGTSEAFRWILLRLSRKGWIITGSKQRVVLTSAGWTALAYDDRRA